MMSSEEEIVGELNTEQMMENLLRGKRIRTT